MYHHVVLFRYGQDVGDDVHRRIHDYAERIRASLDGIVSYAYCRNLNSKSVDYPYAIIAARNLPPTPKPHLVDFSMQYIVESSFTTSNRPRYRLVARKVTACDPRPPQSVDVG